MHKTISIFLWFCNNHTVELFRIALRHISADWEGYLRSKYALFRQDPILWASTLTPDSLQQFMENIEELHQSKI